MSTKKIFPSALALALLGVVAVRAQDLPPAALTVEPVAQMPAPQKDTVPAPANDATGSLSSWITRTRPDCCPPLGGNGPIGYELFLRAGPSLPVEGAIFGHVLETGWEIEGGARSLFFNQNMDRAWSIDLSLSNILNRGQHSDIKFPINILLPTGTNPITNQPTGLTVKTIPTSLRELNRTNVSLGMGHDWFLGGSGTGCNDWHWRVGLDAGGRMGSVKAEFYELAHHTDILGGMYVGLHGDLEIPHGCCTFLAGFRAEWDYNWMDILQIQNNSDLMDVNLLLTLGVRF